MRVAFAADHAGAVLKDDMRRRLEAAGLVCSGTSPDDRLVEVIELPASAHPFFVASQYHPEFKSRPTRPEPLFRDFVGAAAARAAARRGPGADESEVEDSAAPSDVRVREG